MFKNFLLSISLLLTTFFAISQEATIVGTIIDDNGNAIFGANVSIDNESGGATTDIEGAFKLIVPANKTIKVIFSHISYELKVMEMALANKEERKLSITLKSKAYDIGSVDIQEERTRTSTMQRIDPKSITYMANPSGNFEAIIKTLPGVSSNNELSSQYSVRGGNFDENLIYVNDVEIYRPFLVRSGQQEGLSFINSDLVSGIEFSAGGFDAKYGDKFSSVLAIDYKEPEKFAGSITGSLQGASMHIEGSPGNHRFTYLAGVRYRTNRYVLSSLDTDGQYRPNFLDVQTFLTYDISEKWEIGFLGNISRNEYNFIPETRSTDFGTVNEALRLTIYFEGQEANNYETYFGALTNEYKASSNLNLKFITSAYRAYEDETFDVLGEYFIDELERDLGSDNFGDVAFNRGIGGFRDHARNSLEVTVVNAQHKGKLFVNNGSWEWGAKIQREMIKDKLSEWKMLDSAGFSIPKPKDIVGYDSSQIPQIRSQQLELSSVFKAQNEINSNRVTAYLQRNWNYRLKDTSELSFTAGLRTNYWTFNNENIVSPRASVAYKPNWERDFLFRVSGGYYYQAPFYRELRNFEGELNENIKAQQSVQVVAAADYNFKAWDRPFKWTTEVYYKHMTNIIPYEIDNVRIRYYAENNANAYAVGMDMKVNGEFVKGVESWATFGLMRTEEDIKDDFYYDYFNSDGEKIVQGFTFNSVAVDSIRNEPGYIPRPTDNRFNFSLFFQDYLPNNPTLKANLTFHFASGLPFGPPSYERYKDTLRIPSYLRVDIGFAKILKREDQVLSDKNPFRHFKSIWLSAEVFNLLQRNNTISYLWVTDVSNRQYAVPNYLTSRQLNVKLQFRF